VTTTVTAPELRAAATPETEWATAPAEVAALHAGVIRYRLIVNSPLQPELFVIG